MIARDPGTRAVARAMMLEAQAIGERLGVRFGIDVDRRIEGAGAVGAHKTSMLQDLERGRPLEIDALVGAVQRSAGWSAADADDRYRRGPDPPAGARGRLSGALSGRGDCPEAGCLAHLWRSISRAGTPAKGGRRPRSPG